MTCIQQTGVGKMLPGFFHFRDGGHGLAVKLRLVFVGLAVVRGEIGLGNAFSGGQNAIKGSAVMVGKMRQGGQLPGGKYPVQ